MKYFACWPLVLFVASCNGLPPKSQLIDCVDKSIENQELSLVYALESFMLIDSLERNKQEQIINLLKKAESRLNKEKLQEHYAHYDTELPSLSYFSSMEVCCSVGHEKNNICIVINRMSKQGIILEDLDILVEAVGKKTMNTEIKIRGLVLLYIYYYISS